VVLRRLHNGIGSLLRHSVYGGTRPGCWASVKSGGGRRAREEQARKDHCLGCCASTWGRREEEYGKRIGVLSSGHDRGPTGIPVNALPRVGEYAGQRVVSGALMAPAVDHRARAAGLPCAELTVE